MHAIAYLLSPSAPIKTSHRLADPRATASHALRHKLHRTTRYQLRAHRVQARRRVVLCLPKVPGKSRRARLSPSERMLS